MNSALTLFYQERHRKEPFAFCNLILDCFLFQPLTSVETSPESTTQVSDSPESLPSVTVTTSSECSSPEMDRLVSFKYKQHQISQHLIQGKISKVSLPTKSQSFLESLNPTWTLLKNTMKKEHLMSELCTKMRLREKLSLLPAHHSPKLSNQSREYRCVQGCAKSLGDGVTNRTSPHLRGALSLRGALQSLPSEGPQSDGGD